MAYSVIADLDEQISQAELEQLTDDEDAGSPETGRLQRAIDDADGEIDGYLSGRYEVPLSTVPDIIRKFSVDIAIYNLFSRRPGGATDIRTERYNNVITFLMAVAKGQILVGVGGDAEDDSPKITHATRIFSRSNLEGF